MVFKSCTFCKLQRLKHNQQVQSNNEAFGKINFYVLPISQLGSFPNKNSESFSQVIVESPEVKEYPGTQLT